MRSHYATVSQTELDRKVHELAMQKLEEYKDELYDAVKVDVFNQALAVCFVSLEQLGWGKVRLLRLLDMIDDMTNLMFTGIMGREMTTRDAQKYLMDKYGIDFKKSKYKYPDEEESDE